MNEMSRLLDHKLYCLTSDDMDKSHADQVEILCKRGVKLIQLRNKIKNISNDELHNSIETAERFGTTFIINDQVAIAKKFPLHGVHIGREDCDPILARKMLGNNKIIGQTIHSWSEAKTAKEMGICDYVGIGPVRNSNTKKSVRPKLSLGEISEIIKFLAPLPSFLIGGLDCHDRPLISQTGATGVCVCSSMSSKRKFGARLNAFKENGFLCN